MTATTVPVAELRQRLRAPDDGTGEMLVRFAADLGVDLEVTEDWSGRPSVPVEQAAALIAAAEARYAEHRAAKHAQRLAHDAAAGAEEAKLAAAAARTYDVVLVRELDAGNGRAELYAFEAATNVASGKAKPVTAAAGETAHQRLVRGGLRDPRRRKWPL